MDDGYFETLLQRRTQGLIGHPDWRLEIRSSEIFTQAEVISGLTETGLNNAIDFWV